MSSIDPSTRPRRPPALSPALWQAAPVEDLPLPPASRAVALAAGRSHGAVLVSTPSPAAQGGTDSRGSSRGASRGSSLGSGRPSRAATPLASEDVGATAMSDRDLGRLADLDHLEAEIGAIGDAELSATLRQSATLGNLLSSRPGSAASSRPGTANGGRPIWLD